MACHAIIHEYRYGTTTSCEASAENGLNVALRPNLSVAVTV
jgi:hypothetical protein